jgi:hypothetical protein
MRCRFRLHTLLIMVMIVALALSCGSMIKRRAQFLKKAQLYAALEDYCSDLMVIRTREHGYPVLPEEIPRIQREIAYYARLKEQYRNAAAHPWAAVNAEPPGPE